MNIKLLAVVVIVVIVSAAAIPAAILLLGTEPGGSPTTGHTNQTKNTAPVARFTTNFYKALHNQNVTFDATWSSDPDGDTINYSWDFGDGTNGIEPVEVHQFLEDGTFVVSLTVSDGKLFNTASTNITVYNGPPAITRYLPAESSLAIDEGKSINFSITASDPNADPLTYGWMLDGRMLTGSSPKYRYDADFQSAGAHSVRAWATDGSLNTSREWAITVRNINHPPELFEMSPPSPATVAEGGSITLRAVALDPDGDTLNWVWVFDGAVKENGRGNSSEMLYSPDFRAAGPHSARVSFSDGTLSVGFTWAVNVKNTNRPPAILGINPPAECCVTENSNTQFAVNALDEDDDTLTYNWSLDGRTVGDSAFPTYDFVTGFTSAGKYRLKVEVGDGRLSVTQQWNITVTNLNRPPTARMKADILEGMLGQAFNFNGSGSFDPDQEELLFAWDFGDGGTAEGLAVAHSYSRGGRYRVILTVTDPGGLNSTASQNITVLPGLDQAWSIGPLSGSADRMVVEDVDGDGKKELVLAIDEGADAQKVSHGRLEVYDAASGGKEWESPDIGEPASLQAINLDGDTALELVVGLVTRTVGDLTAATHEGKVVIFDGASHALEWEGAGYGGITAALAVDINADGSKELLVSYAAGYTVDTGTFVTHLSGGLAVLSAAHAELWASGGWGQTVLLAAENFDPDLYTEVAAYTLRTIDTTTPSSSEVNLTTFEWRSGSLERTGEFKQITNLYLGAFALWDVNGDNIKELFIGDGAESSGDFSGFVYAFSPSLAPLWRSLDLGAITCITVGNIDGVSGVEIMVGVAETELDGALRGRMLVFNPVWSEMWRTDLMGHVRSISAGDINGDWGVEVVIGSVDFLDADGNSNGTVRVLAGVTHKELAKRGGFHELDPPFLLLDIDSDGRLEAFVADWSASARQTTVYLLRMSD